MSNVIGGLTVLGTLIQPGIELAETGGNVKKVMAKYMPGVARKTTNYQEEVTGRVVSTTPSCNISIEMEDLTSSAAGLFTATFIAGCASLISNDVSQFFPTPGTHVGLIMLDDVEVNQVPGSNRTTTFNLSSDPQFTAV